MDEVFYKALRLVMPENAAERAIPADAPAFVSPIIQWAKCCPLCGSVYRPLAYQVGHVTTAHHFHPACGDGDCGGIYCFALSPLSSIAPLATFTGFVAAVEPLGRVTLRTLCGRHCALAEAVRTRQITAYCLHPATSSRSRMTHRSLIQLEEGILLVRAATPPRGRRLSYDTHPGDLLPLCGPDELLTGEQSPFSFQRHEGTIALSYRTLP
jgi:hypothetical protein